MRDMDGEAGASITGTFRLEEKKALLTAPAAASIIPPISPPGGSHTVTSPTFLTGDKIVGAGTLVYAQGTAFADAGTQSSLINNGTIWSDDGSVLSTLGWFGAITNTGVAVSSDADYQVSTFYISSLFTSLTNTGKIYALTQTGAAAFALWDYSPGGYIDNSGLIAAQNLGTSGSATALRLENGGSVANASSGSILAEADFAIGIEVFHGHANALETDPPEVLNAGLIEAKSLDSHNLSFAITGVHPVGTRYNIVNSGTIRGDYAIYMTQFDPTPLHAVEIVTNLAGGLIDGKIFLNYGNDTVFNHGTITGDVSLGGDNDVYDGTGGQQHGTVFGDAGTDLLIGTTSADTLDGGADADVLVSSGSSTMTGGAGNDVFVFTGAPPTSLALSITDFASGADRIDLSAFSPSVVTIAVSGGNSVLTVVTGSGSFDIHVGGVVAQSDILLAMSSLSGTAGNDTLAASAGGSTLHGLAGDDLLVGMAGNDVLDGGTGVDLMVGGAGDDTYIVDDFHDIVREMPGGGYDTIINASGNTITMGENVERLTGGGGYGNALDNVMIGSSGNDILDGGIGADSLYGGKGNDFYYVDQASDMVFENAGEGTDTINALIGFYLYANVENLILDANGGSIFGVGNSLDNVITGNGYGNLLIAGYGDDVVHGNSGADSIYGEGGNDQLFGDIGVDYIVGGDGNDIINGGYDADAIYGGDGDDILWGDIRGAYDPVGSSPFPGFNTDILVGGNGNDILHGDTSLGDYDLMDGGAGNDIYYVDTPADLTFEAANGGTDTVYADISGAGYYLYANLENLVLLGTTPFGVGNELDNHLTGNDVGNYLLGGAGNDVLNGKGGNDVLFGEAGADIFVFEPGTGGDVIGDFLAGTDKIDLTAFGFASFAQVQAAMGQNGTDSFINLGGGDFVVLNGVAEANLHAGDFILGGGTSINVAVTDTDAQAHRLFDAVHAMPAVVAAGDWLQ